jgi:hypothetical protein
VSEPLFKPQPFALDPASLTSPFLSLPLSLAYTVDAENFGNDDFMGKVVIPLQDVTSQQWEEKYYPIVDPDGKSSAKQLSGSVLVSLKFTYDKRTLLSKAVDFHKEELKKVEKDIAKIKGHINRLEGVEEPKTQQSNKVKSGKSSATGKHDTWLFAEFDDDTPLLFTDIEPISQKDLEEMCRTGVVHDSPMLSGGVPVSSHDLCSLM